MQNYQRVDIKKENLKTCFKKGNRKNEVARRGITQINNSKETFRAKMDLSLEIERTCEVSVLATTNSDSQDGSKKVPT